MVLIILAPLNKKQLETLKTLSSSSSSPLLLRLPIPTLPIHTRSRKWKINMHTPLCLSTYHTTTFSLYNRVLLRLPPICGCAGGPSPPPPTTSSAAATSTSAPSPPPPPPKTPSSTAATTPSLRRQRRPRPRRSRRGTRRTGTGRTGRSSERGRRRWGRRRGGRIGLQRPCFGRRWRSRMRRWRLV